MIPIVVVLGFVQLLCMVTHSEANDEPHCSKYDFEEKVLEKMLRMEFQMEKMKSEMVEALNEMKETKKDIENLVKKVDREMNTLETMYDFEALENSVNQKLQEKIHELKEIEQSIRTPTILFKARTLTKTRYSPGQTMVFGNVYSQYGEGYNPANGIFIVPTDGTYLFGVTLCLNKNGCVLGIQVDAKNILVEHLYENGGDKGGDPCFSYTTVEFLRKDQQITVKALPGDTCLINQSEAWRWNTFYATLIHV